MSSGAPWSVKGIDPRARSRAKSAARREGMTLGEWLNRVILDDGSPEADPDNPRWERNLEGFPGFGHTAQDPGEDALRGMVERLTERIESSEEKSTSTLMNVGQSVAALARRLESTSGRFSNETQETRAAIERAQKSAETLAQRVKSLEEAEGAMSPETVKAFETAFGKLASRLYQTETETGLRLDETEGLARKAAEAAESATKTLTQRLAEIEHRTASVGQDAQRTADRDRKTGEALYGLHGALERLRRRVDAAENLTNDAAGALDEAMARLDTRLRQLEARALTNSGGDFDRRFDELSNDLARIVADTRAQFARELESVASESRVERLEKALQSAERRLAGAETGHSESLSRIGMEITRLARVMDDRFAELERKTGESARDARAERDMDRRLDQVREENRSSVKRIGEEVARLGQSLADRVSQAENRSAEAVEAASQRMAAAVEQLKAQPAREDDLAERLRQSEERTAQRIEAALSGVQERLSAARAETEEALSPVQRAMNALADRLEAIETRNAPEAASPKAAETPAPAPVEDLPDFDTPLQPPPEAETPVGFDIEDEDDDPFIVSESAAPASEHPRAELSQPRQPQPRQPQARAQAVRDEQIQPVAEARAQYRRPQAEQQRPSARIGATADADFLAEARRRAGYETGHPAYGQPAASGGRGRNLVIAMSVLGFIAIAMAAGVLIFDGMSRSGEPAEAIDVSALDPLSGQTAQTGEPDTTPPATTGTSSPDAATDPALAAPEEINAGGAADTAPAQSADASPVIETPPAATAEDAPSNQSASLDVPPARSVTMQDAAAAGDPVARYLLGMERLASGDAEGAAVLIRRAAEQGVPAAQYRYSKLLERGEGVPADLEAARRFTQQAADAGHRRAMHNLGIMYATGSGAPQDYTQAAHWFEEAALMGLGDSQFNLALLFEQGLGVEQSPGDAYAWYSIAAAGGDDGSRTRAQTLAPTLDPATRSQADAVVASFTPRPMDAEINGDYAPRNWTETAAAAPAGPPVNLVRRAQSLLTSLGYDPGPVDGQPGPATREAIVAFQESEGLSPNGRIDSALIDRLERSTPRR
ncbi:peptidoglycan-binding protein [Hyphobacterium marinum]|uniref:Peptidoglycan-binding protein n=1 Tax=Hyphobacterium marinum TaxID=3116574 RepID=A0ABU7LWH9_9PROT|nr:peptidoglycan-binding protein [Hyphobacterium sp. Y6023]MEE2565911.1 peptidoglycan-binding protein [Hyphobacterium sp. Y6023]